MEDRLRKLPDPDSTRCSICNKRFIPPFVKKHYCRRCERSICSSCLQHKLDVGGVEERVCNDCYNTLSSPSELQSIDELNSKSEVIIGIDFGTTSSAVAILEQNGPVVLPNNYGYRITPSCVSFTDDECLVGQDAVNESFYNITNTVYDVKRLLGCQMEDLEMREDIGNWPFQLVNENKKLKIKLDESRLLSPEEISSKIIHQMKQVATEYLGHSVNRTVIAVPANFDQSQRQATKDAGLLAGFQQVDLIHEPTAAAIAYGLNNKDYQAKNILVYDFGGGTLDVSILEINGKTFKVLATDGNTHLGGRDIDNMLVEFYTAEIEREVCPDIRERKFSLDYLRSQCEKAKKMLSSVSSATIDMAKVEGIEFCQKLTRQKLERMIEALISQTFICVENALKATKLSKDQIHKIVMVGGSSRIPLVKRKIQDFFPEKRICRKINPDEAVASGAALWAGYLMSSPHSKSGQMLLYEVTSLSIGLRTEEGEMDSIIERTTGIPVKVERCYTTVLDDQTAATFKVYEGERPLVSDNNLLGEFRITDLPRKPRGQVKFNVEFEIDRNGILNVTASVVGSNRKNHMTVLTNYQKTNEVKRMIEDAQRFKAEDTEQRKRIRSKVALQTFINNVKHAAAEPSTNISNEQREHVLKKCFELMDWMDKTMLFEAAVYESKLDEVKQLCTFMSM